MALVECCSTGRLAIAVVPPVNGGRAGLPTALVEVLVCVGFVIVLFYVVRLVCRPPVAFRHFNIVVASGLPRHTALYLLSRSAGLSTADCTSTFQHCCYEWRPPSLL